MKKLLMALVVILAATASLKAETEAYAMVSAWAPGQIPIAMRDLKGVRFNLLYGECQNLHGFDCGLIGNAREVARGFQLNASSIVGTDMTGAQVGLFNWDEGSFAGFQLGLWNWVEGDAAGCQVAFCNTDAGNFAGFQLGLWNDVDKDVDGFQLGLVNIAGTLDGLQIGLVNWISEPVQTCRCLPIVNVGW